MGLLNKLFGGGQSNPQPTTEPALLINSYATVADLPEPDFPHRLLGRRDRADSELLPHLHGFAGYVFNPGQRQPTQRQWALSEHALRTRHHLSFEADGGSFPALAAWARRANAILFLPDGSVRDPELRLLFDPQDGDGSDGEVPYPDDAEARKERSRASALDRFGLQSPQSLPPVVGAGETVLRPAAEVAARAMALMAVAVRGESLNGGEPIPPEHILSRLPAAEAALSPGERAFFFAEAPEQQAVVNAVWRYEALTLLLWALGEIDALPPVDGICDVPLIARLMLDRGAALADDAQLRAPGEILDTLDLSYRLHWSLVDARQKGSEVDGLVPGVIAERHYALNWLTAYQDADWDDVETPT